MMRWLYRAQWKPPAYLYIDEDQVQIKDASRLRSKNTFETTRVLKEERGESAQVAAIGKAGKNLVKFAAIMTDGEHGRAAGRGGLGAVMGQKN